MLRATLVKAPSTAALYRDFGDPTRIKTGRAKALSRRPFLSLPRLRRGHAASCPSPREVCTCGFSRLFWLEVLRRAGSGVECRRSNNTEGSTCLLPGFHAPNDDGRRAALNPDSGTRPATHARFGKRRTGSEGRGGFCPGSVLLLPESEKENRGISDRAERLISGEGL
jgi:hypothetical protein